MDVRREVVSFVSKIPAGSRVCVIGHSDVDGLAATAIMSRTLERIGLQVWPYVTRKGESGWSESVLQQAQEQRPAALVLVDLGSRAEALLPDVSTLLVDHHKSTGIPEGSVLISGYGLEPTPSSGLLSLWCAEALDASDGLAWLAAASMLADYGDASAFETTAASARQMGTSLLRRLTTLLNAPRRTASGDANYVLKMLLDSEGPDSLLTAENAELLEAAKSEVDAAFARARKTAPRFAGKVALLAIHEACQVHPLVAQTWRSRLRKQIVMCANFGYLPGRVNFAVRTSLPVNLLQFLAEHRPDCAGEDFGRGHDRATGGSLTRDCWKEFARSLGFSEIPLL